MAIPEHEVAERARAIRMVLLDADGILTDGRLLIGPSGEEWKAFDARDGLGVKIAQAAGIGFGVLSGRRSQALERRAVGAVSRNVGLAVVDLGLHTPSSDTAS